MRDALTAPVSAAEFTRILSAFAPLPQKFAVALSGGPDSTALALCAKAAGFAVQGLLVEHGLRAESAQEAASVKQRMEAFGIPVEILPWVHGEMGGRVHEKARRARYDLLLEACARHGLSVMLLGHHAGDQAETVLMRFAKGSGTDGLSGIAPRSMRGNVEVWRPFLALPKARLIATCAAAGVDFATDSSNASPKYARGRLRQIMPALAAEGLTEESLARLAARAAEDKAALDYYARAALAQSAEILPGGCVRVRRVALGRAPRAVELRALALGLRYVNPEEYPPEYDALSALYDALLDKTAESRTLYGCLVSVGEAFVTLMREPAQAKEVLEVSAGDTVLWDGRWRVVCPESGGVRALGVAGHEAVDALAPDLRRLVPQGRARASLPGLWRGETLVAVPSFSEEAAFHAVFVPTRF